MSYPFHRPSALSAESIRIMNLSHIEGRIAGRNTVEGQTLEQPRDRAATDQGTQDARQLRLEIAQAEEKVNDWKGCLETMNRINAMKTTSANEMDRQGITSGYHDLLQLAQEKLQRLHGHLLRQEEPLLPMKEWESHQAA